MSEAKQVMRYGLSIPIEGDAEMVDHPSGPWIEATDYDALAEENARLREALLRAKPLVRLLTVRQVIEDGYEAIEAAGLNHWCMNEGLAEGHERIDACFIESALGARTHE